MQLALMCCCQEGLAAPLHASAALQTRPMQPEEAHGSPCVDDWAKVRLQQCWSAAAQVPEVDDDASKVRNMIQMRCWGRQAYLIAYCVSLPDCLPCWWRPSRLLQASQCFSHWCYGPGSERDASVVTCRPYMLSRAT